MDIKTTLQQLPEPGQESLDRVWSRYRETRQATAPGRSWWRLGGLGMVGATTFAMAAALLMFASIDRDAHRHEVLASVEGAVETWTDEVELTIEGRGEISGTRKKASIDWQSGTVTASVRPNSGNELKVITEEAVIEVVGTVFSVTRDALGVSTSVERGRVRVSCTSGWSGEIGPEDGVKVCLPVRPGALVGRFNKLRSVGASLVAQLETLNAGLALAASGSNHEDQLLLARMEVYGERKELAKMLADADAYLAVPRSKAVDARQYASRAVLGATNDCAVALPFLEALETSGTAVDRVLLAECLLASDGTHAARLLDDALPTLDSEWKSRAVSLRALLPQ